MNDNQQITSELTLEQCDDLLITGVCNIRDAILGYTQHGLTQPQISERVKALGFKASVPTIKRHVADLRKEGLLPAVGEAKSSARHKRETSYQMAQNELSGKPDTQPTPTIPTDDYPNPPAPAPEQQRLQADDWYDATVVTAEVYPVSDGELDFQRALELFKELDALAARNFANGWTELQWNTLGGECRTLAECCDARGKRQRSRPKRQVFALSPN